MVPYDDQVKLQQIAGVSVLPDSLVKEYNIRQRMCHVLGLSGLLPLPVLIDMVRYCGLGEAAVAPAVQRVHWQGIEHDGSVRVEANFMGTWMPGVFVGLGSPTVAYVRLDSDPDYVREVATRADSLRLAVEHRDLEPAPEGDVSAAAAQALLEAASTPTVNEKAAVVPAARGRKKKAEVPDPVPEDDSPDDEFDWAKSGECAVIVQLDGGIENGIFKGIHAGEGGERLLIVDVEGEEMHVDPDVVRKFE